MNQERERVLRALPWGLAGIFLLLAIRPGGGPSRHDDLQEADALRDSRSVSRLERELRTTSNENDALRTELDRLVGVLTGGAASGLCGSGGTLGGGEESLSEEGLDDLRALAKLLSQAIVRVTSGEQAAGLEVADLTIQVLRYGPDSFRVLRDVYFASEDTRSRSLALRGMARGRGSEVPEFLVEQYLTERDPTLRVALLRQLSRVVTPAFASTTTEPLVQAVTIESDTDARIAAIRGLRYSLGQDVEEILTEASYDDSEEIRMAAMTAMASVPSLRATLEESLANEPSERLREIGRCRLILATG